jgi:hypothetical protein
LHSSLCCRKCSFVYCSVNRTCLPVCRVVRCSFYSFINLQAHEIKCALDTASTTCNVPTCPTVNKPTVAAGVADATCRPTQTLATCRRSYLVMFTEQESSLFNVEYNVENTARHHSGPNNNVTSSSLQPFDRCCLACSKLSRCFSTPSSLYRIKQSSLYRLRLYLRT